jgi:lipopolysaccharide biosynthesis regulator YciM
VRQAHYLCEQAKASIVTGDTDKALTLFKQAAELAPASPRPLIELAKLENQLGLHADAFNTLLQLEQHAPQALPLAAELLANVAFNGQQQQAALALLKRSYEAMPSVDVVEAIIKLDSHTHSARDWYVKHLEQQPSLVAATRWIAGERFENEQPHGLVQRALDKATKPLMRYRCAACGFEATQHFWHCPGCQAWDSYSARRIEEL